MPPLAIDWSAKARAHIRSIDRAIAMHIFDGVLHYARTGAGDITPLHGDMSVFLRLRVGDYRVVFRVEDEVMRIYAVHHRSKAYN